jgi:hypothetical protein
MLVAGDIGGTMTFAIQSTNSRPRLSVKTFTNKKVPKISCGASIHVEAVPSAFTANAMPKAALKALATHNELNEFYKFLSRGGNFEEILGQIAEEGIDIDALADRL